MFIAGHHGDEGINVWFSAPQGVQAEMVTEDPERFFDPKATDARVEMSNDKDIAAAVEAEHADDE